MTLYQAIICNRMEVFNHKGYRCEAMYSKIYLLKSSDKISNESEHSCGEFIFHMYKPED
jgi:hypothetical protein